MDYFQEVTSGFYQASSFLDYLSHILCYLLQPVPIIFLILDMTYENSFNERPDKADFQCQIIQATVPSKKPLIFYPH